MKSLGHPARIAILEYLMKVDSCICGDIVDEIPLAQPTISQHLKEMKEAGLIKGNIDGNSICYCIDEKAVHRIKLYYDNLLNRIETKKMKCD